MPYYIISNSVVRFVSQTTRPKRKWRRSESDTYWLGGKSASITILISLNMYFYFSNQTSFIVNHPPSPIPLFMNQRALTAFAHLCRIFFHFSDFDQHAQCVIASPCARKSTASAHKEARLGVQLDRISVEQIWVPSQRYVHMPAKI